MPPKISVVISAYQKAQFLSRTLQSVLDQTFQDLEIIVVDDGSFDNTREIVESFAKNDGRVRYVYQQNQGPGSARNTGIRASQTDLIALLDGDDAWLPDKLEHQVQVMEAFPNIDLLLTNSQFVSTLETRRPVQRTDYYHEYVLSHFNPRPLDGFEGVYLIGDKRFPRQLALKNVFNLSTLMLRERIWAEIGGFNEEFRGPEDIDFWVRAALRKCQFAYSSHVGAIYYKNETSLVQASEKTYLEQLKHALYAHRSPEYEPIRDATQSLVHKRFRQLVVLYTYQRQPGKAWRMFRQSMAYGISARTLLMAAASFLGPIPLAVYGKARRATVQRM